MPKSFDVEQLHRDYAHAKGVLKHHGVIRRRQEKELVQHRKTSIRLTALAQGQSGLLATMARDLEAAEKKVANRDALLMKLRGWLLHQGNYRMEDMAALDVLASSLGVKDDLSS